MHTSKNDVQKYWKYRSMKLASRVESKSGAKGGEKRLKNGKIEEWK